MSYESNRNDWEFEYPVHVLADAAEKQREYRQERVKVWEHKKLEVMDDIRASGLTVHEPIAEKMSSLSYTNVSGGRGAHITVDTTLQTKLDECVGKIQHHRQLVTEYDAWAQLLRHQLEQSTRLQLKHGDWMFFFGK